MTHGCALDEDLLGVLHDWNTDASLHMVMAKLRRRLPCPDVEEVRQHLEGMAAQRRIAKIGRCYLLPESIASVRQARIHDIGLWRNLFDWNAPRRAERTARKQRLKDWDGWNWDAA